MIYFIADLHLSAERPDISGCFFTFLQEQAPKATKLYILGDLFEYWVGDDDDSSFVAQVADELKSLQQLGTDIFFIHGNRDFLLGKRFAQKAGMTLLPEHSLIDIYGQKALIMHGDTLCTDDVDYQKFRKKSRSWWWQAIIKCLPLSVRKNIANNYREQSANAKQTKSLEIMDVNQQSVERVLTEADCTLIIHGHTHRPNIHDFIVNENPAQRIVLGDWYNQGSWLTATVEGNFDLISAPFVKQIN